MARLIDEDVFFEALNFLDADVLAVYGDEYSEWGYSLDKIKEIVSNTPTVDAVEVVRCKECKHHHWEQEPCHGKTVHYCDLPHMSGVEVFKEFFCYYGERKDGDGNG